MTTTNLTAAHDDPIIRLMVADYRGMDRWFSVSIGWLTDGSLMHPSFERALSPALAERLLTHGACAGCGAPVRALTDQCVCGHQAPHGGHLQLEIRDRIAEPSFDSLVAKLLRVAKSAGRRTKMQALPSTLNANDVSLLLQWQRGLCYYCGAIFESGPNGLVYDRDHVVPVVSDGHFTLENTVLACPRCNRQKGGSDAALFSRRMALACPAERKAERTSMRRNFQRQLRAYISAAVGVSVSAETPANDHNA